jgi:hypothetical protein
MYKIAKKVPGKKQEKLVGLEVAAENYAALPGSPILNR